MIYPVGVRGKVMAIGILLIPLILLMRFAIIPAWQAYQDLSSEIEGSRSDLQRYQRIAAQLDTLRRQQQVLSGQQPLAAYLLKGKNSALAAADLQRHLQELVKKHGGRILSLRTLDRKLEGAFERIPLNTRFQANAEGLQQILYALETDRLYALVEQLNVSPVRARRKGQTGELDVQLTISSLRAVRAEGGGRG